MALNRIQVETQIANLITDPLNKQNTAQKVKDAIKLVLDNAANLEEDPFLSDLKTGAPQTGATYDHSRDQYKELGTSTEITSILNLNPVQVGQINTTAGTAITFSAGLVRNIVNAQDPAKAGTCMIACMAPGVYDVSFTNIQATTTSGLQPPASVAALVPPQTVTATQV